MPSLFTTVVLIVCFIQFVLIMNLMYKHDGNIVTKPFNKPSLSLISDRDNIKEENSFLTDPCQNQKNSTLDGVAVTLMLHTPTWFQRRYTMMIQNIHNNLPNNWKIQIIYTGIGQSQAGLDINPGLLRLVQSNDVILTKLPDDLIKIKKYQLMVNPWLWENLLADKVLVFGGNAVICSNSMFTLTDFIHFDYIGSPWGFMKGVGGDGGISIRNRNHMLQAIIYELSNNGKIPITNKYDIVSSWGQEDQFFVSILTKMIKSKLLNSNIATKEDTFRFSAIGGYSNLSVFTASGTLPDISFEERDKFLSYCPELKLLYPSLHDPNCFGASPNAEKCALSICALKVPKRKGGC